MSLSSTQIRILHDMANGAELIWTEAKGAKGGPADLTLPDGTTRLIKRTIMHQLDDAGFIEGEDNGVPSNDGGIDLVYTLTPAGREAINAQ